jgi:tetratricopeptide (TPR) repeat protein
MRRLLALAAVAFVVGMSSPARADTPPNAWDKIKDPTLQERWELHLKVRQTIEVLQIEEELSQTRYDRPNHKKLLLDAALMYLNRAQAATSGDLLLGTDLLDVLRMREGVLGEKNDPEILPVATWLCNEPKLRDEARANACFALAIVHAKGGRTEAELAAYDAELRFESDPHQRCVVFMNRAEGWMRLGRLNEAIEGYRETIALATPLPGTSHTVASAYWGLAVALDRYRDPRGALQAAAIALMTDPLLALVSPDVNEGVFFVPDYEKHWYQAIGWRQKALAATNPTDVARFYTAAELQYGQYVFEATKAKDTMYLAVARERLDAVKKLAAEARAKAATVKLPPTDLEF